MAVDKNKTAEIIGLIEKIADLLEKNPDSVEIMFLKKKLEDVTGRENIDVNQFKCFWGFTSVETLAEKLLMPEPKKQGLSDERIHEIVKKICLADYSEAEIDYWLEVLKLETGLNVSDYIYFPDTKGLELTATEREVANAILADRK